MTGERRRWDDWDDELENQHRQMQEEESDEMMDRVDQIWFDYLSTIDDDIEFDS